MTRVNAQVGGLIAMSKLTTTGAISRRHLLQAGGVLAAGAALGAHDQIAALAERRAADQVALTFWTPGGSARYCNTLDVAARNFMKLHPNISVGKAQCTWGSQDYTTLF